MDVACPDCGRTDGHDEGCHVGWAEALKNQPLPSIRKNPFLAMLKGHDEDTQGKSGSVQPKDA